MLGASERRAARRVRACSVCPCVPARKCYACGAGKGRSGHGLALPVCPIILDTAPYNAIGGEMQTILPGDEPDDSVPPSIPAHPRPEEASKLKPSKNVHRIKGNGKDHDPEEEAPPAALSDDAMAQEFISHYPDWRWNPDYEQWLRWTGGRWKVVSGEECFDCARRITREALMWPSAAGLTGKGRREINSASKAASIMRVVRADPRVLIYADQLDTHQLLLSTPAGVVDLEHGKLIEAAREMYCTMQTSVAPADGEHPLFDRVMARAANASEDHPMGDPDMLAYLWRALGLCCTGDTRLEIFFYLRGAENSGKGTLIKAVSEILGDYAKSVSVEAFIEQKNPRHSQELARLRNARFVHAGEPSDGVKWNDGLVKLLTGGDVWVAHRMRRDDEEFRPTCKIWIHGNNVPSMKGSTDGFKRRLHLIEYPGSIPEQDRDALLKVKLIAEYPQILAHMIRACGEFLAYNSIGRPDQIELAVVEYLDKEDTFGTWIESNLIATAPSTFTSGGDLFRNYRDWAEKEGQGSIGRKTFVQRMERHGFKSGRHGSPSVRGHYGCKLRSVIDPS